MRTPRAVNNLIDDLFERKYRKVGQEKNALGFFSRRVFCFNIVPPGKGSKYREFYDLSGRITCMCARKQHEIKYMSSAQMRRKAQRAHRQQ